MPPRHKNTGVSDPSIIEETIVMPSTLETIDEAFFQYVDEVFNIHTTTRNGFEKVPILWMTAERSYQIKNDKNLRDKHGSLILPIATIERTSVEKDPTKKGIFFANVPPVNDEKGGSIVIARKIKQNKTRNFANADAYRLFGQLNYPFKNKKIVYQTVSVPMPVYVTINYSITLRTEYQQQMNEMLTPFITKIGGINYFVFKKDKHSYEAFIEQEFAQDNNISALAEEEKMYQTAVNIRVLGHLIGQGNNQDQPKIVVRENAVSVKIPRERVINKDEPEHDDDAFYRS
tara:strand:+ start:394 stop:1257 length:864 start_codon:yes stop_codon:yes gene_type:complete